MLYRKSRHNAAQLALMLVLATPMAAQTATPLDSAPPAPRTATLLGFKLSGYVETAYNMSNQASGNAITGRLYERTHNQVSLNAVKLTVDRPINATAFDAGFHADLLYGQNAPVLQSAGFNLGRNRDVYQLYGTLNVPTPNGNGLQVKVGRMATFLGMELIETPLNPNVSIANQFIYVENFTQTGVSVEHRVNKYVDAQLRVLNGWDQVKDANQRLSYMARVGINPNENTSLAFAGFTGPEQANNNSAMRSGVEVLASRRVGRITTFVQGDLGREQMNDALPDPTRDATWWAAGTWVVIDATEHVGVALRADYLADNASARTGSAYGIQGGAAHRVSSATATLNVKTVPHVLIRPELRFDRSSLPVFASRNQQTTFGLNATFLF